MPTGAEGVPELIATKDQKTVDPLQIIALLTKVVQAKDAEMRAMKAEYDAKIESQQERLTRLETILTNIAHKEDLQTKETVSVK